MVDLTPYQKQVVQDNGPTKKFWVQVVLIKLVLIACMAGLYAHTFGDYPEWLSNFAVFGIVLYIVFEWFGLVAMLLMCGAMVLSRITIKIVREAEQESFEMGGKAREAEQKFLEGGLKIPSLSNTSPLVFYLYRGSDMVLDVVLFVQLIACGMIFSAIFHAIFIPTFFLYQKIIKHITIRLQNLTPPDEEDEGIDDLADKLFHGEDE